MHRRSETSHADHPHPAASLAFCLVLLLCLAMFWLPTQVSAPNERSRLYLAHALATRGEIDVTAEWERWGAIFDIAARDGRMYADKAPGSSVLAMPAVRLAYLVEDRVEDRTLLLYARFGVMLPAALAGMWLLLGLLRALGVQGWRPHAAVLGLYGASHALHYGHAYFGHALVMTALLATWRLTQVALAHPSRALTAGIGAGCAGGIAFAIEYQAALVLVALGIGLLSDPKARRWSLLAAIGVGALPWVALTLAYNHAAFGNALSTSYQNLHHEASVAIHQVGFGGVSHPTLRSLSGLLVGPARGLLFAAPALLLAPLLLRTAPTLPRWLALSAALTFAGFLYVAASFGLWTAGWGMGPRILLPALPALAIALALVLEQAHRRGDAQPALVLLIVGWASSIANLALVATFPESPPHVAVPLREVALPMLTQGCLAPNLLHTLGWVRPGSALPFLATAYLLCGLWALTMTRCLPRATRADTAYGTLRAVTVLGLWILLLASFATTAGGVERHLQWACSLSS